MPAFAFYIQKSTPFQGEDRPFGNVYHYLMAETPSELAQETWLRDIIEHEKSIAVNEVDFLGGRVWGPTDGTEFDNVMRADLVIQEQGNLLENFESYREACLNIRWPLPRSQATNSKRWLRKYMRMSGTPTMPVNAVQGFAAIPDAEKDEIITRYVSGVRVLTSAEGQQPELCTEDGVLATGEGQVRDFYITRQIGT